MGECSSRGETAYDEVESLCNDSSSGTAGTSMDTATWLLYRTCIEATLRVLGSTQCFFMGLYRCTSRH